MGVGIDTVSGGTTAVGLTPTAWTLASGDSLTVRNATPGSPIWLLNCWTFNTVAGFMRVRSPRLHDNVQGIRTRSLANDVELRLPVGQPQRLYPQDTLIVEVTGSGVAAAIEQGSLMIYYADLPGVNGVFVTPDLVRKNTINLIGNEIAITAGTALGYSGSAAINFSFDNLVGNTWYAVLGMNTDTRVATVTIKGPDTGNLRVPIIGETSKFDLTSRFFELCSAWYNLPLIPCINSANKAGTFVEVLSNNTAASPNVTLVLAELTGIT